MSPEETARADVDAYLHQDREACEAHRDTDLTTVLNGRIVEIQVFFGGQVR